MYANSKWLNGPQFLSKKDEFWPRVLHLRDGSYLMTIQRSNVPLSLTTNHHFATKVRIGFWGQNPLPSILRRPRKLLYQYWTAIWSIFKFQTPYFVFLSKHCRENSKSLKRSAWRHIIFKCLTCKESWKGFPQYSRGLQMGRSGKWNWSVTWPPIVWLLSVVVYQKILTTGRAIFTDVVHEEYSLHLCCITNV